MHSAVTCDRVGLPARSSGADAGYSQGVVETTVAADHSDTGRRALWEWYARAAKGGSSDLRFQRPLQYAATRSPLRGISRGCVFEMGRVDVG